MPIFIPLYVTYRGRHWTVIIHDYPIDDQDGIFTATHSDVQVSFFPFFFSINDMFDVKEINNQTKSELSGNISLPFFPVNYMTNKT